MKNKQKQFILKTIRIIIQAIFLIFYPSVFSEAYAGAKEIVSNIGKGQMINLSSHFIISLIVLLIATFFIGRFFCGWVCAFGAIGDWIYNLSDFIQKKSKKKFKKIPQKAIPYLQKIKYVILFSTLLLAFLGMNDIITFNSPWTIFSLLLKGKLDFSKYIIGLILFILIVLGMAIQERFFCQFLCPMGAIFSFIPELPLFKLKRNSSNCIKACNACQNNCPVSIKLNQEADREGECIKCGKCKLICPKKNIHLFRQPANNKLSNNTN